MVSKYSWIRTRYVLNEHSRSFLRAPWAGGVVLLSCVIIAMLLANLPATADLYHSILTTDLSILVKNHSGSIDWIYPRGMNVETFINDALMVIFFFTVGLEIKREIVCGQLSSVRRAILPVLGAAGGMLAPALIFTAFNHGTLAASGWGIPTATDIAFAIGIMSLLGDKVPISLKVFLTALAIADDLGAIIVIALFYGGTINWTCLGIAAVIMVGLWAMNRLGERRLMFYLVPAIVVWSLFYYSGVHSTISGVVIAMLIPIEPRYSREYFYRKLKLSAEAIERIATDDDEDNNEDEIYYISQLRRVSSGTIGMSDKLEHALNPYVTFIIMPIFALANAGVRIESAEYFNIFHFSPEIGSVGMGVFFGLLIGKPLGIFTLSWLSIKSGLAEKPSGASWKMLFAVACLGGIGFTMSIFVDSLAYTDPHLIDRGKIAILLGSAAAAVLGTILIAIFSRKTEKTADA